MTRTVPKLKDAPTTELKELALDLSIGAQFVDVLVQFAELYVGDRAAVGTIHSTIRTVGGVRPAARRTPVAHGALIVSFRTFPRHVFPQLTSQKRLFTDKRTGHQNVLAVPLHFTNVEMQLDVFVFPLPFAAPPLHRAVHVQSKYPVAELPVEQRGEIVHFANWARLVHVLDWLIITVNGHILYITDPVINTRLCTLQWGSICDRCYVHDVLHKGEHAQMQAAMHTTLV